MLTREQIQENKETILRTLHGVERPGMDNVVSWLEWSDFFKAPASTRFHGCYEGALAAHSLGVYRRFCTLLDVTPEIEVPDDSRKISGLLHDVCKVDLYVRNYGEFGLPDSERPYKSVDEAPFGHGEKSVKLLGINEKLEMTEQEQYLIRWHMGPFDPAWRQYERRLLKLYPEVLLLHHADHQQSAIYEA